MVADLSEISFEFNISFFNKPVQFLEMDNSRFGRKGKHGINIKILHTKDRLDFSSNVFQQFLQDIARMFQFNLHEIGGKP